MTVTLAYSDKQNKTAWIASDSCASDSVSHSLVRNPKVFHPSGRPDVLIGCAGSFRLMNLLQHVSGIFPDTSELSTDEINMEFLVNEFTPVISALTEDFDSDESWELLVAVGDRIYRMQMDYSIIEPADDSDAIGIGGPVALGAFKVLNQLAALQPTESRMKQALQVACDSCHGCLPPYLVMRTKRVETVPTKKRQGKKGYSIIRRSSDEEDLDVQFNKTQKQDNNKKSKKNKKNKHNK